MTPEFKEKVFQLYENEIAFTTFKEHTILVEALILYKELGKIDSYLFDDIPLSFTTLNNAEVLTETPINRIVFGGTPYFGEEFVEEKITGFLNAKMQNQEDGNKFRVYLNSETRTVQITDAEASSGDILLSYVPAFYVCAIITRLLPWYFSDIPVNDIREYVMLFSSREASDIEVFERKFEEFVESSDIKNNIFKTQLKKISDVATNRIRKTAEDRISEAQRAIEAKFIEIHRLNSSLRECRAILDSMTTESDEYSQPIDELIGFISSVPNNEVKIVNITDNAEIEFEIHTKLEYYDEYDSCIKNDTGNSILLGGAGRGRLCNYPTSLLKRFYKELIEKNTINIYSSTRISLNVLSGRVSASNCGSCHPNAMPHPHLAYYGCFGSDAPTIVSELTLNNRYADAMNQLLYCAKQVTLADGAAMGNFIKDIENKSCIECPDGQFRNFNEAMNYLIEEGIIDAEYD